MKMSPACLWFLVGYQSLIYLSAVSNNLATCLWRNCLLFCGIQNPCYQLVKDLPACGLPYQPACCFQNVFVAVCSFQETEVCPQCDSEIKADSLYEHMCASEFALKVSIREVKKDNGDRKLTLRKKKALKKGPIQRKDWGELVLFLKNGANCPCPQLEQLSGQFLVLGRKVKNQHILTAIHKWDKGNREFNRFMRKVKKNKCPKPHSAFM